MPSRWGRCCGLAGGQVFSTCLLSSSWSRRGGGGRSGGQGCPWMLVAPLSLSNSPRAVARSRSDTPPLFSRKRCLRWEYPRLVLWLVSLPSPRPSVGSCQASKATSHPLPIFTARGLHCSFPGSPPRSRLPRPHCPHAPRPPRGRHVALVRTLCQI